MCGGSFDVLSAFSDEELAELPEGSLFETDPDERDVMSPAASRAASPARPSTTAAGARGSAKEGDTRPKRAVSPPKTASASAPGSNPPPTIGGGKPMPLPKAPSKK